MTISKTAAFRGISECKIASVTVDSGAAYSKGTLFDVPIRSLTIAENYETLEMKQDDCVQAVKSVLMSADITGVMAKIPLDVLDALDDYFFLEVASGKAFAEAGDVTDVHIQFKKCMLQSLEYAIDSGFATVRFVAKAIRTLADKQVKTIVFNGSRAAIN